MHLVTRNLVLVLGDQLNDQSTALAGFDPAQDAIWMAEVDEESTHVPSAKQRTTLFLSAMRHFAQGLRDKHWPVIYSHIDDLGNTGSLAGELDRAIGQHQPRQLVMTAPGDWRVLRQLRATAEHGILMEGAQPIGGQWNFDADNRSSFGKTGPGKLPAPTRFEPDAITREVMDVVNTRFADHPGSLAQFGWPVTRVQALQVLADFIQHRLPQFGQYQDAIWEGEVWLYHSHVSCALNLKLLNPREVVAAAENAFRTGHAPLEAVEGFVRQVLGWREYVRGIYWTQMPDYMERNAMQAHADLPAFFWSGDTDMACLRDAIGQTLMHGYAHHIQRLMVTGLYALLFGVHPKQVHAWYLSVYVDAVEWVELPNTLGMSQYADGGLMASKPYVASGKYIDRMSNHCKGCRYNPAEATGEAACPFTTLYWDYLSRHADALAKNPRMLMQLKNLNRMSEPQRTAIATQAQAHRAQS